MDFWLLYHIASTARAPLTSLLIILDTGDHKAGKYMISRCLTARHCLAWPMSMFPLRMGPGAL